MSLESKLLLPDRLSVIAKMFSWPVGSKDEGAAPEIDSQIDPDITLEYQPRDRPLIPESARAEFLADHERVPEKNRGLESVLEGAQGACFRYGMGPSGAAPEAVVGASPRTADLHRVNFEVQQLKPFACLAFPYLNGPKRPVKGPSFGDEL